jgi:hypothetical protein
LNNGYKVKASLRSFKRIPEVKQMLANGGITDFERYKKIYYIRSAELTGNDHEATVDGIHFTDLGFDRITTTLLPVIRKALQ